MYEKIKEQLNNNNLILFVGAGVPATLGIPTWSKLIAKIADELEYDPEIFMQHGDYFALAEYYILKKGHLGELRDWISREWSASEEMIKKSKVYKYITELNCNLIYTTNYEHSLEDAFRLNNKAYKRIVDVCDLVNVDSKITQIVKFHGDVIKDDSIVLSESDYFRRLDFESPLDIKLRSDMLGRSILFIGYSLSDINIRLLVYKLDTIWKKTNQYENRPESFVFLPTPNTIQESIFANRKITPIVGTGLNPSDSLESFLEELTK